MIHRKVRVYWLSEEEGGRTTLYRKERYVTNVRFPGDGNKDCQWSMVIDFTNPPSEQGNPSIGIAHFLVDAAPHEQLQTETGFNLYEGPKKVAHVDFID